MRRLKQPSNTPQKNAEDLLYPAFAELSKSTARYGHAGYWWGVLCLAVGVFFIVAPVLSGFLADLFSMHHMRPFAVSSLAESDVFQVSDSSTILKTQISKLFWEGQQILFEPLLLAVLIAFFAKIFLAVPFYELLLPWRRLSLRKFGLAAAMGLGSIALLWVGYALLGVVSLQIHLGGAAGIALWFLLPIVLAQTLAEEFVFRGVLLRAVCLVSKNPLVAVLLSAVLFAALHIIRPDVLENPILLVVLFVLGFFWCLLTLRARGIEYAWGLHFSVNYISLAVLAPIEISDKAVVYTLLKAAHIQMWVVLCIAIVTFFLYQRKV